MDTVGRWGHGKGEGGGIQGHVMILLRISLAIVYMEKSGYVFLEVTV
jgi:hypothetical protein